MIELESDRIIFEDEISRNMFHQNYMFYEEYDELISQIEQMEDSIVNSYTISISYDTRYCYKTDTMIYYGIIHAILDYLD